MPPIWFGNPQDDKVARRINRFEDSKRNRMLVGVHVASDYSRLSGALLVVSGRGKYLQASTWKSLDLPLPQSLQERACLLSQSETHKLPELRAVQSELAVQQAVLVQQLKESAGKYVDRILAVSLTEPGLWVDDFDGQKIYFPNSLPVQLAELTGLNVIDAFPGEDVEGGGSGLNLEALPLWLLLGDRHPRAATESRIVIMTGQTNQVLLLPGSDGADTEVPNIIRSEVIGISLVDLAWRHYKGGAYQDVPANGDQLQQFVSGRSSQMLLDKWNALPNIEISAAGLWQAVLDLHEQPVFEDVLRSIVVFCGGQILQEIIRFSPSLPLSKVSICGDGLFSTLLLTELSNRFQDNNGQVKSGQANGGVQVDSLGPSGAIHAVLAGILGFLTIDQMPANLPWITGCQTPKILGRTTKGRPVAWRQLLVEMADYHPPAMKLREAI